MRAVALAILLVGCGRVGFDDRGVALDSRGDGVTSANSVTTLSLTTLEVGDGPDECLIAALILTNQSATDVALRWNGTLLTAVTSEGTAGTSGVVFVQRLIAPDAGIQTLSADWTGESDAILGAISVSGADQDECVRAVARTKGTSDTASVTIPSAPGHLTIDVSATPSAFGAATQMPRWTAIADGIPEVLQNATHTSFGTVDSCVLPAPATAGHTLVFIGAATGSTLLSVVGAGVTWQPLASSTMHANVELWSAVATTGPATTITYSGAINSSMRCWVGEFTGLNASGPDAASFAAGTVGDAAPGELVTTNPHDLLLVAYSGFGPTSWGVPTEGPWTSLGEVADAMGSQVAFVQPVGSPGSWNPSIAKTSADTRWDAVASALAISRPGIAGALSTATGAPSNLHSWSLASATGWVSVGLDVFP